MVRLAIDFENSSRTWWESGGRALWESITEGFDTSEVVLEESLAKSWLAQAEVLAGWDEGPPHAPHPVLLKEVSDDEEV